MRDTKTSMASTSFASVSRIETIQTNVGDDEMADGEILFHRQYEIDEHAVAHLRTRLAGFHYFAVKVPETDTIHEVQQRPRKTADFPWGTRTENIAILQPDEIKSTGFNLD